MLNSFWKKRKFSCISQAAVVIVGPWLQPQLLALTLNFQFLVSVPKLCFPFLVLSFLFPDLSFQFILSLLGSIFISLFSGVNNNN